MNYKIVSKKDYDEYVSNEPLKNMQQNIFWGDFLLSLNNDIKYVLFYNKECVIGAALLVVYNDYIYIPRGFITDYGNKMNIKIITELLLSLGIKLNKTYIKIEPNIIYQEREKDGSIKENGYNNKTIITFLKELSYTFYGDSPYKKYTNSRYVAELDLNDAEYKTIYENFSSLCKKNISTGEKNNLSVRELKLNDLKSFSSLVEESAQHHHYIPNDLNYYKKLYNTYVKNKKGIFIGCEIDSKTTLKDLKNRIKNLEQRINKMNSQQNIKQSKLNALKEELSILNNKYNEINNIDSPLLAGAMFIYAYDTIYYYVSGSSKKNTKYCAPYLIQNYIIKYAIENNYKYYNFLGISGIFTEDNPRIGLTKFKQGFNPDIIEYLGEFDLVCNKYKYQIIKIKKVLRKIKNKIKK